jgi:hypothetical protein
MKTLISGLMAINNEPLMRHIKSGTDIGHKHTYFGMSKKFLSINNYKHDDRNFEVMSNKFNKYRISTAIISSQKNPIKL